MDVYININARATGNLPTWIERVCSFVVAFGFQETTQPPLYLQSTGSINIHVDYLGDW